MNKIKINGREIRKGVCSCLKANVQSKEFGECLRSTFLEEGHEYQISITEAKIIELINKANSFVVNDGDEKDVKYLVINTDEYDVVVSVPKEVQ